MEFALSEEQLMIRDSAERFLAQASDSPAVREGMARTPGSHGEDGINEIQRNLIAERALGMPR